MTRCDMEICPHWTGDGCACRVLGLELDPDLFQCSICEQFRSVDERHVGNGHTHPGDWCDACADGPGLWRLRKR